MQGGSQYSDPSLNPTDLAHMLRMLIVARHHVFGAHVAEGLQHDAGAFLDEALSPSAKA